MTKVLITGTGDPEFGRNRQIIRLLHHCGCDVSVRTHSVWAGDKARSVTSGKLSLACRAALRYVKVIATVVGAGVRRRPDVVMILHPSQIDAVVVGLVCKVFRLPLVIDFFVSLHETVVQDRRLLREKSLGARFLRWCDRCAAHMAAHVMADTPEDAEYFARDTRTPSTKWSPIWVGADQSIYAPQPNEVVLPHSVLFYGTYIPLQGIEHIVRASALLPPHVSLTLIGDGQERERIEAIIKDEQLPVHLIGAVSEHELADHIARASVCLGVFGDGPKTSRVIPNKVFQCLAMGKAIVTGDTPAISRLGNAVAVVPVADPTSIAAAVLDILNNDEKRHELEHRARSVFEDRFDERVIADDMADVMGRITRQKSAIAPLTIMGRLREPYIRKCVQRCEPRRILEIGAGQGAMGTRLAQHAMYVGLEPDTSSASVARQRLSGNENADFRTGGIERLAANEAFDVVCAFEVLEHIEDDVAALRQWCSHVTDNGIVIISVPAHQSRYGVSDRAVGHFRRYDATDISDLCERADCEVVARHAYGAIGGHALETVRNLVLQRRGATEFGESGHHDVAARTAASGRLFQPSSRWGGILTALIAAPMRVIQAPFSRTSVGVGWVVALRKRGTV
jgi:glycosyltransferase involved in cell wall biosynthesis